MFAFKKKKKKKLIQPTQSKKQKKKLMDPTLVLNLSKRKRGKTNNF